MEYPTDLYARYAYHSKKSETEGRVLISISEKLGNNIIGIWQEEGGYLFTR